VPRRNRPAPRTIWIAEVLVSEAIAEKIHSKHRLDPYQIATRIKSPPPRFGRYVTDHRGTRLYVRLRTGRGVGVLVVLRRA
jgi:hypothetical protein